MDKICDNIKKRITSFPDGEVFFTSDFIDISSLSTIRKCLGRLVQEGTIRRVIDGAYEKPKYSYILNEFLPIDPDIVANALARKYHWTIAPCGDVALNKLGLSTQVPVTWSYVSDGPYRKYEWENIILSFNHRTNREISLMSNISIMVIEALKTLGQDKVDEHTVLTLKNNLNAKEKEHLLQETMDSSSWIYEIISKVCKNE